MFEALVLLFLFMSGFCGAFFGSTVGGGGLITLPALLWTGLPVHQAMATNRFGAFFLELGSVTSFKNKLSLRDPWLWFLSITVALSGLVGGKLMVGMSENGLKILSSLFLVMMVGVVLWKPDIGTVTRQIGLKGRVITWFATIIAAVYGGFMGVGFGTFILFIFCAGGMSFLQSAGMSRVVGLFLSGSLTLFFVSQGLIQYGYAIPLALGTLVGGWCGAKYSLKKGDEYVRSLFLLMVSITVLKLIWDVFSA